jgi:transposase
MENGAKQDDGSGPKARRARRSFTDEFKAGAVRLVLDEGKSIGQVARDLDLTATALSVWVKRARADRTNGRTGLTTEERAELAKLRKENRELRIERDILKNSRGSAQPVGREARAALRGRRLGRSGRLLFGGSSPLKNMVQGAQRT